MQQLTALRFACVACSVLCAFAPSTMAQLRTVGSLHWEVSDGTSGWHTSLTVPPTQSSVRMRLVAGWTQPQEVSLTVFGIALYDGVVQTNTPKADTVSDFITNGRRFVDGTVILYPYDISGIRQGNTLKIDQVTDLAPPGEGPSWLRS